MINKIVGALVSSVLPDGHLTQAPLQEEMMMRKKIPARIKPSIIFADITHFLDEKGEIPADLPQPAASLASFLALVIDATTETRSSMFNEIGLRCRIKECTGSILSRLESEEIIWHCPVCGHNGIIRNWQATKWNQKKIRVFRKISG